MVSGQECSDPAWADLEVRGGLGGGHAGGQHRLDDDLRWCLPHQVSVAERCRETSVFWVRGTLRPSVRGPVREASALVLLTAPGAERSHETCGTMS